MKNRILTLFTKGFLVIGISMFLIACSFQEERKEEKVQKVSNTVNIQQAENSVIQTSKIGESESANEIEEVNAKENISEEKLRFIDAWNEWHDIIIDSKLPRHNYDYSKLLNTDSEISYLDDERYYIRKGVDVSYHQGSIDWEKVKKEGIEFAIIRIGYRGYGEAGALKIDPEFKNNIINARKAGIEVGVYFFSQAISEEEASEEAQLVIDELESIGEEIQLPVVYDPELIRDKKARTEGVSREQFTNNTTVFCEKIKDAGYEPMIYSNMVWEAYYFDLNQLTKYPIWYADYEQIPQTPYWFSYWQYSCDGSIDGISTRVDLNIQFIKK